MNDAATELSVISKGKQTIASGLACSVALLSAPCAAAKSKLVHIGVRILTTGFCLAHSSSSRYRGRRCWHCIRDIGLYALSVTILFELYLLCTLLLKTKYSTRYGTHTLPI